MQSKNVKLTEQEISLLRELFSKYNSLIVQMGNLTILQKSLSEQMKRVDTDKQKTFKKLEELNIKQKEFNNTLQSKYGKYNNINVQTWELIKQ